MKKILLAIAVGFVFASGCTKKCDLGYEGNGCRTETRTTYFGVYTGTKTESGNNSAYTVIVGATSQDVLLFNVNGLEAKLENEDGDFTFTPATFTDINGTEMGTLTGFGNMRGKDLNFSVQHPLLNGSTGYTYSGTNTY